MDNIFTTSAIKPHQRAKFWERFVCKFITDVDCSIHQPDQFYGEISSYTLGRTVLSTLKAAPHKVGRTDEGIKAGSNAPFMVIYQKSGIANYSQCDHPVCLQPGDSVLYDPLQPYHMELPEPFEQILFQFPRNVLKPLVGSLPDIIGRPVTRHMAGGDIYAGLIEAMERHTRDFDPIAMQGFAETIISLIVQVLDSELCPHQTHIGHIGSNVMARAKQYIISNLKQSNLSLNAIALHTGVSPRHLNRLFQAEGPSVLKWVKMLRLERCGSALVNPYYSGSTIAEIAYEFGFNDISHFCRDFKKMYNLTPSEYRNFYFAR